MSAKTPERKARVGLVPPVTEPSSTTVNAMGVVIFYINPVGGPLKWVLLSLPSYEEMKAEWCVPWVGHEATQPSSRICALDPLAIPHTQALARKELSLHREQSLGSP